jgi:hypothetical protein
MRNTKTYKMDFQDLQSDNPKVKYGCTKKLLEIGQRNPDQLYSHIEYFIELLDNKNQIIRWMAIDIIGFLAKVDKKKRIDQLMERLFGLLKEGKLITTNHAIATLAQVALAKSGFQKEITEELLKVEDYNFDTEECRNIALGKVIVALDSYSEKMKDTRAVIEFAKRQTRNRRNATKKKAERLLKRLEKRSQ